MKKPYLNQKGNALIEFVIVLPLLLILLFASIEFGFIFFDKAMLTNASREGARQGIVYNFPDPIDDTIIRNTVKNYCQSHLITFGGNNLTDGDIDIDRGTGTDLTVTVFYTYDFLVLPNFTQFIGLPQTITLTAVSVMRMEG